MLALVALPLIGLPPLPDAPALVISIIIQLQVLGVLVWFIVRPRQAFAVRKDARGGS